MAIEKINSIWIDPIRMRSKDPVFFDIGDVYSFYMNNSLYASNSGGSVGPNGVMIGKYPFSTSENANGAFSFLLIYNRVLTTAEMTQNYNYFKGRFGL